MVIAIRDGFRRRGNYVLIIDIISLLTRSSVVLGFFCRTMYEVPSASAQIVRATSSDKLHLKVERKMQLGERHTTDRGAQLE